MNLTDYSIDRPHHPITTWLLALVIIVGLVVLGIAAYNAFSQVMTSPIQAVFAAALIEISAIVEALSFVRGKNWIGAAGLVVSLIVSGTYNYIQAKTTGAIHGITGWWQLGTLAFGPLIALAFLSLTLGQELRKHEIRVQQWQNARAEWRDQQAATLHDEQERQRQDQLAREEADRKARNDIELARIAAESQQKIARIRAEERERSRKEREVSAAQAETYRKVSADWRQIPAEDRRLIAGMTTEQIMQAYQVSDRTARNWRAKTGQNGKGEE